MHRKFRKYFKILRYSWFHIKGTTSVNSFNGDYLSIPEGTGSCGYLFHEIPGIRGRRNRNYAIFNWSNGFLRVLKIMIFLILSFKDLRIWKYLEVLCRNNWCFDINEKSFPFSAHERMKGENQVLINHIISRIIISKTSKIRLNSFWIIFAKEF